MVLRFFNFTRPKWLLTAAMTVTLVLGVSLLPLNSPAQTTNSGNTIYFGGDILTMVGDKPQYVEAIAVKDGKIAYVGTKAEALKLKGGKTSLVDLQGKTLLPGFIDAHGHFVAYGKNTSDANLKGSKSVADVVNRLKEQERKVSADAWIVGLGYKELDMAENRPPTADELDQVATDRPVVAINNSGHGGSVNNYALKMMGWTSATPDPTGGVIIRKPGSKDPLGPLQEQAFNQVRDKRPSFKGKEIERALKNATEAWLSTGQTTAMECGVGIGADDIDIVRYAIDNKSLPLDLVAFAKDSKTQDVINEAYGVANRYLKNPQGTANALLAQRPDLDKRYVNRVRLGGIKFWLDGEPFTAWMSKPFTKTPPGMEPDPNYRGYSQVPDKVINDAFDKYWKTNMQINMHVNGDQAAEQALQAIEAAVKKHGMSDHRPVFVHSAYMRPDQIKRIKQVGGITTYIPIAFYRLADGLTPIWGTERAANSMAIQSAIKDGIKVTLHHDAPIQEPAILPGVWAAVNRVGLGGKVYGEQERISPYQGLQAVTVNAAYQIKEEKTKGTLEVGKLADLVILEQNPLKVDPMTIKDVQVVETIKEGQPIYRKSNTQAANPTLLGGIGHTHDNPTVSRPLSEGNRAVIEQLAEAAITNESQQ